MSNKILLVVLIHNRKNLLRDCLKSTFDQTFKNFEILLFDNFSTDGARELASIYAKKYKHIHLFCSDSNLGQQKALNYILTNVVPKKFVDAQIWATLDSDDELYPNALLEVHKMYKAHEGIAGTYSDFDIINRFGNVILYKHAKAKEVPGQFTKKGQLALRRMFVHPKTNICGHLRTYSIKKLKEIGGFTTARAFATDVAIFGTLMERFPIVKIPKTLYKFRQHDNQIQSQFSPTQTEDFNYYKAYFKKRWTKMGLI